MTNSNPGFFASKKQAINIIASEEAYNNLSSFTLVEELNKTIRAYRDLIREDIKRTDLQSRLIALLELLKRHSCKQVGVSYMCKNTIAAKMKLSYKTVQRLMKKLEELGMIRQLPMKRKKDMMQTANAIIIQPVKEEVSDKTPTKESEKCPTIKTTTSFLKQNIKTYKERKVVSHNPNNFHLSKTPKQINNKAVQESNFIPHWIPKTFSKFVSNFYSDSKTIKEFWIVVKQCNRDIGFNSDGRAFNKEQEIHIAITAFKEFVTKVKSGVYMKKGIFAYFNGIVNKIMSDFYGDLYFYEESMESSSPLED
ncbi:helix-turn-helix domain-containing protein [Peribacillus castrilensis]|uniref:helix-turn-helix domain-containing protein n=1 Tax=Peribacillus castrilensis TaxID=2897690 RepID=UPI003D289BE8